MDDGLPPNAAAELSTRTPARWPAFAVSRDIRVPMRDGVRLSANLFTPAAAGSDRAAAGPWPVVLIRLPYGKDASASMWARRKYWARRGYACLVQDVRGKFDSEGEWRPFVNEAADGVDTLDWIAAQPWCDGAIGMSGESYYGYTQWAVAGSGHPCLRCIAPGNTSPDPYLMAYRGGALGMGLALWACVMESRDLTGLTKWDPWHLPLTELDRAHGVDSPHLHEMLAHPQRDEFWRALDVTPAPGTLRLPVLHWGGWYDVMLPGTLHGWRAAAAAAVDGAEQRLIIGPTDHSRRPAAYGADGYAAEGSAGDWSFDHQLRFFDRWLAGDEAALVDVPRLQTFAIGAERWRGLTEWPPANAAPVDLVLKSGGGANSAAGDGRLEFAPPVAVLTAEAPPVGGRQGAGAPPAGDGAATDEFTYDPARPVDAWLCENPWDLTWTHRDRRAVEARADVLVYTSALLARPLEVGGEIAVHLWVTSTALDTDIVASLIDVFPDGVTQQVQTGIQRARARSAGADLDPDRPIEFVVDLAATSYVFAAGHRLRLEVTSSDFSRFARNLNTAADSAATRFVTARQRIHHSSGYRSRLILPVTGDQGRSAGDGEKHASEGSAV